MKNTIKGTDYIPSTKVMAWLDEVREIINQYPKVGTATLRIEHSFTRTGYKVSNIAVNELFQKVEKYPHTSFQKRPEIIKLVHDITEKVDRVVDHEKAKTVELIRLSDGAHIMATPEMAKEAVEEFKIAKYA